MYCCHKLNVKFSCFTETSCNHSNPLCPTLYQILSVFSVMLVTHLPYLHKNIFIWKLVFFFFFKFARLMLCTVDCRLKMHEFSPARVLLDLMWNFFISGPLTLAGEDWLSGFILWNPVLSIRTPGARSSTRSTSFIAKSQSVPLSDITTKHAYYPLNTIRTKRVGKQTTFI